MLEAYDEPQFSPHSHGFRPGQGCHTALREIPKSWSGVKGFIEGDIAQCFDSLDHEVMLSILRESIHDNRFLRLLANLLTAGYLEDWRYQRDAERSAARWRGEPDAQPYLPGSAGSVRRKGPPPGTQPWSPQETRSAVHGARERRPEQADRRGSRRGQAPAKAGAADPFPRSTRSGGPPALVRQVRGRLAPRV